MGFSFRKQKKVGPFRITASKNGLGASVGLGPLRFGQGATGRRTLSVKSPIKGLNYQKRLK